MPGKGAFRFSLLRLCVCVYATPFSVPCTLFFHLSGWECILASGMSSGPGGTCAPCLLASSWSAALPASCKGSLLTVRQFLLEGNLFRAAPLGLGPGSERHREGGSRSCIAGSRLRVGGLRPGLHPHAPSCTGGGSASSGGGPEALHAGGQIQRTEGTRGRE